MASPLSNHFDLQGSFIIITLLELSLHFSLHNLLLFFKSASVDLVNILTIGYFFLAAVRVLLLLSKYVCLNVVFLI